MMMEKNAGYVGFEYMEVPANSRMESLYVDSYRNFGWEYEGNAGGETKSGNVLMKFKRDRKIRNKAELSRLQRQFEACAHEIETLEKSETTLASIVAYSVGLAGTALLDGASFSYLAGMLPLMVVLAVPGLIGWIAPYFFYQKFKRNKSRQVAPIIEQKHDEIYEVCQKGCSLLTV